VPSYDRPSAPKAILRLSESHRSAAEHSIEIQSEPFLPRSSEGLPLGRKHRHHNHHRAIAVASSIAEISGSSRTISILIFLLLPPSAKQLHATSRIFPLAPFSAAA